MIAALLRRLHRPTTTPIDAVVIEPVVARTHRATNDNGDIVWPDDPDEVPAWRLELEADADAKGIPHHIVMPSYRTRGEYDAMLAAVKARIERPTLTLVAETVRPLTSEQSARAFITTLRRRNEIGEYTAAELDRTYLEWAEQRGPDEPPVATASMMKAALGKMATDGVYRSARDTRKGGKRVNRLVTWVILPETPFDDDSANDNGEFEHDEPLRCKVA